MVLKYILPTKIGSPTASNTKQLRNRHRPQAVPRPPTTACSLTALELLKRPKQARNRLEQPPTNWTILISVMLGIEPRAFQCYTEDTMKALKLLPWLRWNPERWQLRRADNPTLHWEDIPNYLLKVALLSQTTQQHWPSTQAHPRPRAEVKKDSAFGTQGCHSSPIPAIKGVYGPPFLIARGAIEETKMESAGRAHGPQPLLGTHLNSCYWFVWSPWFRETLWSTQELTVL